MKVEVILENESEKIFSFIMFYLKNRLLTIYYYFYSNERLIIL